MCSQTIALLHRHADRRAFRAIYGLTTVCQVQTGGAHCCSSQECGSFRGKLLRGAGVKLLHGGELLLLFLSKIQETLQVEVEV